MSTTHCTVYHHELTCENPVDEEEDDTPVAALAPKQVISKKKFADEDVSDEEAKVSVQ